MPINSRAKGKRGELEAVKYLKSLGFADARRTVQYNGRGGRGDVECPESLPNIHLEVKFGVGGLTFGTDLLKKACQQAQRDSCDDNPWAVLWKPKGSRQWRMSMWDMKYCGVVTAADDGTILNMLRVTC